MDVYIDIKQAVADLRSEFSHLTNGQQNLAIARAINHVAAKAKTQASRDIRQEYNVKAKDLKSAIYINKATRNYLEGTIIATGRPLPIMGFAARQTKKGVTVDVMGQRKLIRGSFMATMNSGHRGVFARGNYSGYNFQFRDKRIRKQGNDLAINELTTSSVPKMMQNNAVLSALEKGLTEDFPSRLRHELSFLTNKVNSPVLASLGS